MSWKTEEEIIISYINEAVPKIRNKRKEITGKLGDGLTYRGMIGYGLGYFLTNILKAAKDTNFCGKWIDDVEWTSLVVVEPSKIRGRGFLWWGPTKDYPKLFSEKFYAELTIEATNKTFSSYYFQFQIDGKKYELIK